MRSLTHISFYPPPSMPPVQPATAWYCPRILTTAWAMWPGGAVMEYRPMPFLPNGELGLKMATDVSMSLVEGASISSAFERSMVMRVRPCALRVFSCAARCVGEST